MNKIRLVNEIVIVTIDSDSDAIEPSGTKESRQNDATNFIIVDDVIGMMLSVLSYSTDKVMMQVTLRPLHG